MYLSSRVAACVGVAALLAVGSAQAGLAARSGFAGMRPTIPARAPRYPYSGIAPTIVSRGARAGYAGYRGIGPTIVSRGRRGYGYGYGGGGLGYDGDFTGDGFGVPGLAPPLPGFVGAPPFAMAPPPAPCPQIIEIGGGLAHKAATHVVSGGRCGR